MKKEKRKVLYNIIIAFLIVVESIFVYLSYKSFSNKDVLLDEVNLTEGTPIINGELFAFMLEQEDGTYEKTDLTTWPTDMIFNASKSTCVDADGYTLEGVLSFDDTTHEATVTTNTTTYCYLYFSYEILFTFYLGGVNNPSHTSTTEVTSYLNWDDNDIESFCITNTLGTADCTWISATSSVDNSATAVHSLTEGDGVKIAYAYLKDADGTISDKVIDRITLDTVSPTISTVTNTAYSFDYITISVAASDDSGAIRKYHYKIGDEEIVTTSTNTHTFTKLHHGTTYEVSVYVEDVAGNISEAVTNEYSTKVSGLGTTLEGGLYRFQGNDVMNYICFGTTSQTDCLANKSLYMYRIIGYTESGQMKLIKSTSLGTNKWHNNYTDNTTWPQSDLYKALNGDTGTEENPITPIFIDSSTYTYLTTDGDWYNKIAWTEWNYGDTTSNGNYDGDTIYAVESAWGAGTSANSGKQVAKIGLMYIHDYYYAYGVGGSPGTYTEAKTAWIFLGAHEWTLSRYGKVSTEYRAWSIHYNGIMYGSFTLADSNAVRPVFYLTSNVEVIAGTGSSTDPLVIN